VPVHIHGELRLISVQELQSLSQSDQQGIAHVWTLFSAAPSKHRNLMLQGILAQCCFPQLSFLSSKVRDLIKIDFMSALPTEIGFKILRYLDTTSLCKAAQVSRRWRQLADDDVVWHRMCEQHIARKCKKCGWGLPLLERKRLMASKHHIQMRALSSSNLDPMGITPAVELPSPFEEPARVAASESPEVQDENISKPTAMSQEVQRRPWKDVYKDRFKVGSNWKHGRYSTKMFRGHSNGVMCLQFDEHIVATGSYDATIKIWDIESGKEIRTLRGHTSGVRCLQFDGSKLISGSLDHTLRVWNWRTGECVRTLTGHSDGVISLNFAGTMLVSGSVDETVRIWDFEDGSTTILRGHTDWVNSVKIDIASRTLFTASDDLTAKLWDLDTKLPIKVYKGHVGHVQQVVPLPAEFELDDLDHEQYESSDEASSTQSFPHLEDAHGRIDGLGEAFSGHDRPQPPRYMLTAALDCNVRLWDVHTGHCLRTFFGHVEGVWALAADMLRVVSGAEDRMVKVWDARSGKCERTFTGHTGPVTCIGLSDSRMCTGSEDGEVRMFSFKTEVGEDEREEAS
jgi:F-box/WD-40 domain protein MET30